MRQLAFRLHPDLLADRQDSEIGANLEQLLILGLGVTQIALMLVRKPWGDIANIGLPEQCIMVTQHVYNKVYRLYKVCLTSSSLPQGMYSIDARDGSNARKIAHCAETEDSRTSFYTALEASLRTWSTVSAGAGSEQDPKFIHNQMCVFLNCRWPQVGYLTFTRSVGEATAIARAPVVSPARIFAHRGGSPLKSFPR